MPETEVIPFKNQEQLELLRTYLGKYANYFNVQPWFEDSGVCACFDADDFWDMIKTNEGDNLTVSLNINTSRVLLQVHTMDGTLILDRAPLHDEDGVRRIRNRIHHLIEAIAGDRD